MTSLKSKRWIDDVQGNGVLMGIFILISVNIILFQSLTQLAHLNREIIIELLVRCAVTFSGTVIKSFAPCQARRWQILVSVKMTGAILV